MSLAGIGGAVIGVAINALTTMLLEANSVAFLFWFLLGIGSQLAATPDTAPGEVPPESRAGKNGASESGGGLRWWRCDLADPDVYYGITEWDSLEALKAYETGSSQDIMAAVRPYMTGEFAMTYCEERYLWLAIEDYSGA